VGAAYGILLKEKGTVRVLRCDEDRGQQERAVGGDDGRAGGRKDLLVGKWDAQESSWRRRGLREDMVRCANCSVHQSLGAIEGGSGALPLAARGFSAPQELRAAPREGALADTRVLGEGRLCMAGLGAGVFGAGALGLGLRTNFMVHGTVRAAIRGTVSVGAGRKRTGICDGYGVARGEVGSGGRGGAGARRPAGGRRASWHSRWLVAKITKHGGVERGARDYAVAGDQAVGSQ
jgi:hypothetical protein